MRTSQGARVDDGIKKFIEVFAVQGLTPTHRYSLTTGGMGWWRVLHRGNGTKNVENHGSKVFSNKNEKHGTKK